LLDLDCRAVEVDEGLVQDWKEEPLAVLGHLLAEQLDQLQFLLLVHQLLPAPARGERASQLHFGGAQDSLVPVDLAQLQELRFGCFAL